MLKGRPPKRASKPRDAGTAAPKTPPRRSAAGDNARLALLRAAEKLMAERGIDAVSLREVSAAGGHANNSAVAYHFGTREALLDAALERHSHPVHQRWDAQLDLLARRPPGPEYLSIAAQLSVAPRNPPVTRNVAKPRVQRLVAAMLPFYAVPEPLLPARLELLASTLYASIVARHRLEQEQPETVSRAAFAPDLVDTLVALVLATSSSETVALLPRASARAAARTPKRRS